MAHSYCSSGGRGVRGTRNAPTRTTWTPTNTQTSVKMPARSSLLDTRTANPHYAALAQVREHLAPTLQRVKGSSHGLAVDDRALKEAKDQVAKTRAELVAKGLDEDMYTAALMQGTHPEDGGGTGTPFITLGDGNCLLNAVALQYVRAEGRAVRAAVPQLAAKLRLSVVLEGLRHMEAYLSLQEDIFCCWDNYTGDVYDRLTAAGWCVEPDTIDKARVGSRETARLFFVAQLHNIAVKGQWLQQFVLPILATVIQAPIRVFVPLM
ncbi:unnamed protein product [Ectocarpus sp. CCAP 1310/34]|nr:unnamed protein product [Ectocarpus sp. CCAP 1310/34]